MTYESRGVQVPAVLTVPEVVSPCPLVVLCHGHGGSKEEGFGFALLAEKLRAAGIASIRMDFPGCGESSEPFTKNTLANMKRDALAAVEFAKAQLEVSSLGVFGYSMGGRIALELLAEGFSPDAAAMLAPAANARIMINLLGGQEAFDAMRAQASRKGFVRYTPLPLVTQTLSREWFEALLGHGGDPAQSAARAWQGPALVVCARDDTAVPSAVPEAVALSLNAKLLYADGYGHSYGMFCPEDAFRHDVLDQIAGFFAAAL